MKFQGRARLEVTKIVRVVIVDDEKIILDGIKRAILKVYPNFEINCFINPNKAIEFINTNYCDVALLDIQMPEISGLELAKKIRDIKDNINIIFITGYSEYAINAFELNASGYVIKPPRAHMHLLPENTVWVKIEVEENGDRSLSF